jgi:predicted AlkP superfamily pyrophosphatase or phosphodiesterase
VKTRPLTLVICALLALSTLGAAQQAPSSHRVILISIDGLRPEVYLNPEALGIDLPNLERLAASGTIARKMISVFPSVTYPAHTSLVTGSNPARHGVTTNPTTDVPFRDSRSIQVPTLWDFAHDRGLRAAIVNWPVSCGAEADVRNPECGSSFKPDALGASGATPDPSESPPPGKPADLPPPFDHKVGYRDGDLLTVKHATDLIIDEQPHLLLVHFLDADHNQHQFGPDHRRAMESFEFIDGLIGEIVKAVETAGIAPMTNIVVVGDHGFLPVHSSINLYAIYNEMLEGTAVEGMVFTAAPIGGVVAVYGRRDADPNDIHLMTRKTEHYVKTRLKDIVEFVDKTTLAEMDADPNAEFALVASLGYMLTTSLADEVFLPAELAGVHGYLPTLKGMETGFIASGPAFREAYTIPQIRVIDVAPTIARIWGGSMESAEGVPLVGILREGNDHDSRQK